MDTFGPSGHPTITIPTTAHIHIIDDNVYMGTIAHHNVALGMRWDTFCSNILADTGGMDDDMWVDWLRTLGIMGTDDCVYIVCMRYDTVWVRPQNDGGYIIHWAPPYASGYGI